MDSLHRDTRVETGPWGRKEFRGLRTVGASLAGSWQTSKGRQPREALASKRLQNELLLPVSSDATGSCRQRCHGLLFGEWVWEDKSGTRGPLYRLSNT